jgi:hypothetical protein
MTAGGHRPPLQWKNFMDDFTRLVLSIDAVAATMTLFFLIYTKLIRKP